MRLLGNIQKLEILPDFLVIYNSLEILPGYLVIYTRFGMPPAVFVIYTVRLLQTLTNILVIYNFKYHKTSW
jgi:hypothetical protein